MRLQAVCGDSCPMERTIYNWISAFKSGRESAEDLLRSGRPTTATSSENVACVEALLMEDQRITVDQLALAVGISIGSVHGILHDHLGMGKVSARWVPKLLSKENKKQRVVDCKKLLAIYNKDSEDFFTQIVTGDESWFHYYEPESKEQSKQWKHPDSPPPKKAKAQQSAGKRMATVFWDCEGILLIEWLPEGKAINSDYYIEVLKKLREAVKSKRRGKLTRHVLLQHDNATPHSSAKTMAAIKDLGFELLPHPPYSPDLAPSDYWLFGSMKKPLRGKRYANLAGLASAISQWIKVTPKEWFAEGLRKLPEWWNKCITLNGDYVEKVELE